MQSGKHRGIVAGLVVAIATLCCIRATYQIGLSGIWRGQSVVSPGTGVVDQDGNILESNPARLLLGAGVIGVLRVTDVQQAIVITFVLFPTRWRAGRGLRRPAPFP